MSRCGGCRGFGRVEQDQRGRTPDGLMLIVSVVVDCPRCLGAGRVDSNGIAYALEAWRWLKERSREREALAALRHEIAENSFTVDLFADAGARDLALDELDAAAGGVEYDWRGRGMWVGRRWTKATGDMLASTTMSATGLTPRQHRAQVEFWRETCPAVVDLLRPLWRGVIAEQRGLFGVVALVVAMATACGPDPEVVVCRTTHVSPHFTVVECSDGTRTVDDSCPEDSVEVTPTECECTGGRGFVYDEVDGFTCADEDRP